jgi:hypothetical protein
MFIMYSPFGAILFGITIGFTSLIPLTALNNDIAYRKCQSQTSTHTLVSVRGFSGTTKYCVDSRYL